MRTRYNEMWCKSTFINVSEYSFSYQTITGRQSKKSLGELCLTCRDLRVLYSELKNKRKQKLNICLLKATMFLQTSRRGHIKSSLSFSLSLQFVAQPNCQQLLATLWYDGFPGWRRRHWAVKLVTCFIIGLLFPVFSLVWRGEGRIGTVRKE